MTSSNKLLVLLCLVITACTAAQSPLKDEGTATFAIYPDRVRATAELGKATKETFGRPKTQRLHFSACLQSLATGENVAVGTAFSILDGTGGRLERATDPSGCLNWDEDHDVSPVAPERNVRVQRQIKALGNHRGTVTLTFNVKPWLEGGTAVQSALTSEKFADAIDVGNSAGGFGFAEKFPTEDRAAVVKSADAAARREDDKTHFELTDNQIAFNFVKISRESDFRVDRFLNLEIPYQFNFTVRPLVARRSFSGTMRSDPLTEGRVKLTFVFFASNSGELKEDSHYLTSVQWTGEVTSNGMLTGAVVIRYPHVLFAAGRQTVLVQISAPDQPGVEPRSYSGIMPFIDQRGSIVVLNDGRDAEKIYVDSSREREERARARKSPFEEFLAQRDPRVLDIDQFPTEDVRKKEDGFFGAFGRNLLTRDELTYALAHDQLSNQGFPGLGKVSVETKLCRAFLYANVGPDFLHPFRDFRSEYVTTMKETSEAWTDVVCAKPRHDLNVEQLDFIETLGQDVPRAVNLVTYNNQEFAIGYSKDHGSTQTVGFGLKSPPVPLFSAAFGIDVGQSYTNSESRRSNWGQSQTMAIDVGSMEIRASVRHCVLVTPLQSWMPKKPWLICSKDVSPVEWRPESFFYYSQIFSSAHSPMIDPYKAQVGIKVLVRGSYKMKRLAVVLSKRDFSEQGFDVFIHARPPDMTTLDTLGPVDGLTEQSVPGAILRN